MSERLGFFPKTIWKLPGLGQLHQSGIANTLFRKGKAPYWGRFKTSRDAIDTLPVSRRGSFDNELMASRNIETFSSIHLFDWPVMFFLQKQMEESHLRVVTDFGGHIGVKFYAYRKLLNFPADLTWQVVDVPAMVREGRRRLPPDVHALQFFERAEETVACDVLLCSGVLQYVDATVEEIVVRLPRKPRWIVLNKVNISQGETYFTLEDHGRYTLPFRVIAPKELEQARNRLGYTLTASWTIPYRDIVVHSSQGTDLTPMIGEAWTLDETVS